VGKAPLSAQRPFPGPEPYDEQDQAFFRGRTEETEQLLRLIDRHTLTVLFGASGLGKSSLLMAGLAPQLRTGNYLPVRVRLRLDPFDDDPRNLCQQLMARVRDASRAAQVEAEGDQDRDTLWEFFHQIELWNPESRLLTPVIVLDQFEEVFTLGDRSAFLRAAVEMLFDGLGDVIENRVPELLAKRSGEDAGMDFPRGQAPVRVVLSLRQEYLPHLEAWKRQIPSLAGSAIRLWLRPFSGTAARAVILEAARHLISPDVADTIVRAVAARRSQRNGRPGSRKTLIPADRSLDELVVEPSLLNLFCYQLNERRIRDRQARIDSALIEAAGHDILSDFYRSGVAGLGKQVPLFIEEKLLSPSGHRLSIPAEDACSSRGIDEGVLNVLEERRLLRRETRHDTTYIELVHDVLAETILAARDRRRRERRGRRRVWGAGASALMVAVVVGASLGWRVQKSEVLRELDETYSASKQITQRAVIETEEQQRRREQARAAALLAMQEEMAARQEAELARQTAAEAERKLAQLNSELEKLKARERLLRNRVGIPERLLEQ
jgi:hypothetical protein